jgi:hypothetical protein
MPMTTPSHNIVLCLQYTWGGFFKNEATSYVRPMSWLPKLRFLNKSWCLNSWRSSCWKMSLTFDEITIDVYEITRYNLSGLIWIANRLLSILLKLLKALANARIVEIIGWPEWVVYKFPTLTNDVIRTPPLPFMSEI